MYPIIVSFYTNDWEYPKYAEMLKQNCIDLGLDYCIEERDSTGDYISNTALKPQFILDMLEKYQRPILWIDCDGSLLKKPEDMNVNSSCYDFSAAYSPEVSGRTWHVGTLWFNYNEKVVNFVKSWIENTSSTDDCSFENTWAEYKDILKSSELKKEYFNILPQLDYPPPNNAIIIHRLSKSPSKLQRKYNS